MNDLISRQAAIDAMAKAMPSLTTPDGSGEFDRDIYIADEAFVDCMQIINDLPPAQPEHLTGHWIRVGDGYTDYFKCSECGELSDYEDNFCCGCGADMRERDEQKSDDGI